MEEVFGRARTVAMAVDTRRTSLCFVVKQDGHGQLQPTRPTWDHRLSMDWALLLHLGCWNWEMVEIVMLGREVSVQDGMVIRSQRVKNTS